MGETLQNLYLGFSVALAPNVLMYAFIGCVIGTLVGVLPGVGPLAGISLLLPISFGLNATTAIVLLAGIYYGAKYGGSTTSILLNVPGESASVVTCLDGYQLARQGRAGPALGIAAISSFVAGTFGVVGLMFIAPPVAQFALRFGPPEYFGLMVLGLTMVVFLTGRSVIKGILATLFGLWLAGIGTDVFTAQSRFTFGHMELLDGIDFIVVSIGLFAIGEVLVNLESKTGAQIFKVPKGLRNLLPSLQDLKDSRFAFVNGSIVGFFIGVLPGAGSTIASFLSYGLEKAFSRRKERFGSGVIEGVAAPEGANNSETGGALVPLLTLGIPGSATTAILLAALYSKTTGNRFGERKLTPWIQHSSHGSSRSPGSRGSSECASGASMRRVSSPAGRSSTFQRESGDGLVPFLRSSSPSPQPSRRLASATWSSPTRLRHRSRPSSELPPG